VLVRLVPVILQFQIEVMQYNTDRLYGGHLWACSRPC